MRQTAVIVPPAANQIKRCLNCSTRLTEFKKVQHFAIKPLISTAIRSEFGTFWCNGPELGAAEIANPKHS